MEKVYTGVRNRGSDDQGVSVSVVENAVPRSLMLRLDLKEHSPSGFEWSYGIGGPAQLSLAILADVTGNDDYAVRHHHWFKLEIISKLPWQEWKLTEDQVWSWIQEHHPLNNS